jgi:hypothetical protein
MRAESGLCGAARRLRRLAALVTVLSTWTLFAGCDGGSSRVTAPARDPSGGVRLNVAANVTAAPGAMLVARALYTPAGSAAPVTIGLDSATIGGAETELRLRADVDPCLRDAEARGTTCIVELDIRLRRDGRELDVLTRRVPIASTTVSVPVLAVELFEVSTVAVQSSAIGSLEPGDTRTYTVVALDRNGAAVQTRNVRWSVVQGGVTLLEPGRIRADTPGPAQLRVEVGGRSETISLSVDSPSIATLQLAPGDTSVTVGDRFTYRVVARSATGALLSTAGVRFEPCDPVVCVSASDGIATARAVGSATVRAIASGRNGVPVSAQAIVRIDAPPVIALSPTTLAFETEQGQPLPEARTVAVTNAGGGSLGQLIVESVPTGLSATLDRGQAPATLTVRPTEALPPGVSLTRLVRVRSASSGVAVAELAVTVTGRQLPPILVDQELVPFSREAGEGAVSASVLVTTAPGRTITGLTRSITYGAGASGWLTATLGGSSTPSTLVLQATPGALPAGSYTADVVLSATSPHQPRTVRVTMIVNATAARFAGRVVSAVTQLPIAGAIVTIRPLLEPTVFPPPPALDSLVTAADGTFRTRPLARLTDDSYRVIYAASGFEGVEVRARLTEDVTQLPTAALVPLRAAGGVLSGSVRDGTTDAPIVGATVELRGSSSGSNDPPIAQSTTDAAGRYAFPDVEAGTYRVRAGRTGFTTSEVNASVSQSTQTAPTIFLLPLASDLAWRVVLSWGANPQDLDAYLAGPNPSGVGRFQIAYFSVGSLTTSPFAQLDIDVQTGFGPETITIGRQSPGVYRFFVNRFDGTGSIGTSGARVDLYRGNTLVRQFFPPTSNGDWWNVFELNGESITTINTIGTAPPEPQALPGHATSGADALSAPSGEDPSRVKPVKPRRE